MRFFAAIAVIASCVMGLEFATPVGAVPNASLVFEETCSPTTFRPNEWVAVDCVERLTNQGQNTVPDVRTLIFRWRGALPSSFVMWTDHDGRLVPIGPTSISFPAGDIAPGQVYESETLSLIRLESPFEFDLGVMSGDGPVQESLLAPPVTIRLTPTPDATEPPTDLLIETRPAPDQPAEATNSAVYDTTITNRSSEAIGSLNVTLRPIDATLLSAEPAARMQDAALELAWWNLGSFDKLSLEPGDTLKIRTTLGLPKLTDCAFPVVAAVVQATVGGDQRAYAAISEESREVGPCPTPAPDDEEYNPPPNADEIAPESTATESPAAGAITPPSSGQGESGGSWRWQWQIAVAGTALLVAGALGVSLVHRRRAGRFGGD